ncbi:hypothetical protein BCU68_15930 [Vibrio sp. 10N.286.49.B3]|uniref:spondin domain-containing protein n=1 Tax=Vibrio sp. 10N.286.49.B3 TaxID=1880855 RepID=UPI000C83D568|nr:spondin domain-containing protein [Vibrio sp. 10N.286.49.B3]PMH40858.1 hypothetical protein BCU68_15930 [Vibrio sp. 10N.286.49.B3]
MKYRLLLIAASIAGLVGCPDDSNQNNRIEQQTFTIEVKNVTANQPLSPLAILLHDDSFSLFTVGDAASTELEQLAESGDNSSLLELKATESQIYDSISGSGVILPSQSDKVTITADPYQSSHLSVATMLVNTNDGFLGESGILIQGFDIGDQQTVMMNVWDAGSEMNSETQSTIPGPAGGGEGFNAQRDDSDKVSFHPGVISQDDGLTTSILNSTHRFLNPGAALVITRIE